MEKQYDDLFKITEQTAAWSQEFCVLTLGTQFLSWLLHISFKDQTMGRNLVKLEQITRTGFLVLCLLFALFVLFLKNHGNYLSGHVAAF